MMAERAKGLLNKILEWWNKFSTRQKTFIISAGAGIILAFTFPGNMSNCMMSMLSLLTMYGSLKCSAKSFECP